MAKTSDFQFKLLLIGDTGVGKSCILKRFSEDAFNSTFVPTVGKPRIIVTCSHLSYWFRKEGSFFFEPFGSSFVLLSLVYLKVRSFHCVCEKYRCTNANWFLCILLCCLLAGAFQV